MLLSEPTTKSLMKIGPYYQQQKCRPMTVVSGNIRFMRIFPGVLWRGVVKRVGLSRMAIFSVFGGYFSDTLEMRPVLLYSDMQSVVGFSVTPKRMTLNDLATLAVYFALNSVFSQVWLADRVRFRKIIAWKLIKIDTDWQQCKSSAWALVSGSIRFVRIFDRVL